MSKLLERISQFIKRSDGERTQTNTFRLVRLILAGVIFALAVVIAMPTVLRFILLALSSIAAGYDLVIDAINSVEERDYFAASLVLVVTALLAFMLNYPGEAAAMILVYQFGKLVLGFIAARSRKAALDCLSDADEDTAARIAEREQHKEATELKLADTIRSSGGFVLKLAMAASVLYAVLLLFLGDYSLRISLHRALMIVVVCTPASLVAAMPLTGLFGLCFSAQEGVEFNSASTMEKMAEANAFVFDKAGTFSQEEPRVLAVYSDLIDSRTLMNFAAHAVYYSEQPFSQAISSAYGADYMLEVISDFHEIPGGVQVQISGNPVLLATAAVMAEKGIRVPQEQSADVQTFYLVVSGRYVGRIEISAAFNLEAQDLAANVMECGINRCILLTDDGREESQRVGEALGFDEVHGECDTEKKLKLISELKAEGKKPVYVYANGFEAHSEAEVDIRVGKKSRFADVLVKPENLSQLPFALQICRRMQAVATENAVFAFMIKAILIFLSMIGYSKLWFVVFLDLAAAVATQLHASRVTQEPLLNFAKNRR